MAGLILAALGFAMMYFGIFGKTRAALDSFKV